MTVLQHLAKELETLVILLQETHCTTTEFFDLKFLNIIVLWQDDKTHIIFGTIYCLKFIFCTVLSQLKQIWYLNNLVAEFFADSFSSHVILLKLT